MMMVPRKRRLMVARKLPSELEEEILVRVQLRSLVRFRSVCKGWDTLFNDKRFASKQLAFRRPEFMLHTGSRGYSTCLNKKTYSISVSLHDDPTIQVHDLNFDIIGGKYVYGNCDGYFFIQHEDYDYDILSDFHKVHKGGVVWNPLLRQIRWIQTMVRPFNLCGIMVYNGSGPDKSYNKIVGNTYDHRHEGQGVVMFDFETNAWKTIDHAMYVANYTREQSLRYNSVSLNGNLYWTSYNLETGRYFIRVLDVSKEIIKPFCVLPFQKRNSSHTHVLAVYKGDRFSLLEECKETRRTEIWVTKNKISSGDDGDAVEWIKFMTISRPNYPRFYHKFSRYMVDDNRYGKTFILCCSDKRNEQAYVYIVRGDMRKKIKIDQVPYQSGCSIHVPSLIPFS